MTLMKNGTRSLITHLILPDDQIRFTDPGEVAMMLVVVVAHHA